MIHYGADYYPEHWPAEVWDEDLRLMAETVTAPGLPGTWRPGWTGKPGGCCCSTSGEAGADHAVPEVNLPPRGVAVLRTKP